MKLKVLYREDGRIVSLSRLREKTEQDDAGVAPLRSSVEPREGQRVAVLELDESWDGRPLSDIHERFAVAEHKQGAQLVEKAGGR